MSRVRLLWTTVILTGLMTAASPRPGGSAASPIAPADWLNRARDQVERAEYHFSPTVDGAFSAPNRSQGLRLRADAEGVRLSPRRSGRASWSLGLALRGYGRDGEMLAAGPAAARADGEKFEQRREGLALTEWYINGARGIEQGYTLDAPPAGGGDGSPVVLDIAFTGSLTPRSGANGRDVEFADAAGEVALLYQGLMAVDAAGARVDTSLSIVPGALRIGVRDEGHPYPIVVDPTVVVPSWVVYGDQFDEQFGASVAGAGDVNGDGIADIIVGAYKYDGGVFDEGRAFLFYGSLSGPSSTPAWTFESNQVGAWLGYSVAGAGDVNGDGYADVVVGAPLYDNLQVDQGRVFVFLGSSGGPGAQPAWTAEIAQSGARFGSSVASAGDVNHDGFADVIVGAPLYDSGQNLDEGRAFVYLGSQGGLSAAPVWSAGSGVFSSGYGTSVASAGDVNGDGFGDIVVGAPLYDQGGFTDEGRAYVYLGSSTGPSAAPVWMADGGKNMAQFGASVAGAGDVNGDGFDDIIVGAPSYDAGRVFAYYGSATGPSLSPDFNVKLSKGPAALGASVAGVGDMNGDGFGDVAIGAPSVGTSTSASEGSVRVYFGGAHGLGSQPDFTVTETHANAFFGGCVAGAGDVNGDGLADLVSGAVGLDNPDNTAPNAGGVELILGFRVRQTGPALTH